MGQGVYVQARIILNRGMEYEYNHGAGCIALPKPKTWELVAGFSHTDTSDRKALILGGIANSASLTLNYQINKWLTWRFNYSYTHVSDRGPRPYPRDLNVFQTRIQALF